YADLAIQDLAETHPALSSVREIEKGAKRAAELTRQMLAYSGKGRFVIEAMDVSALMDDMAHLLRTSIPRTVALNLHLDHSLPAIEADASQVQQVVMNLITNAADAIGDEDGAIALATGAMDCTTDYLARNLAPPLSPEDAVQPGAYVFFEVSDTGCGMDEEARAKLFEPFFTTKFTGRGLGMAAVQGIVRGHKGAIVLDTEPGKGSTFRVLLPVAEGEQTDGAEEKTKAPETADWSAQGTILVVDDEAQIRNLMQLVLKRKGFTVLTADDGRHAVEVFQEHKDEIICVLLDLTMPHMGGEETYAELHRICENVQVILVSGYSEQELEQRVEDLGFAGFLTKPVGSKMLLDKVRLVLNLTEGV
ncbi:MAG: response regulator, partial [bacterium]|nr:response regulator [bacterium]